MFGDKVKNWMTMNEPKVIASYGHRTLHYGSQFAIVSCGFSLEILSGVSGCIYLVAEIFAFNIGFPLDLAQLIAEERGLTVDVKGINAAMDEARERSRSVQTKQAGGTIAMDANSTASLHKMGVSTTNDHRKFIWFQDHESTIKAIYCGTEFLESAEAGKEMGVVLESMSFYAEQGGQVLYILLINMGTMLYCEP
ncbi:hypothetical protein Ancab_025282 [Ancistrocladus abbreviatus]